MTDIFDFITADTPEGREFAEKLREETVEVEVATWTEDGKHENTATEGSKVTKE